MLRLPQSSDIDDLVAHCNEPDMLRWTTVPAPYTGADAQKVVDDYGDGWPAGRAWFTLQYRQRFAGNLDFRFDEPDGAHAGYALASWARGQGVMTGALRTALNWEFGTAGIDVVYWQTIAGNWASRGVTERCGFRVDGSGQALIAHRGDMVTAWSAQLHRDQPRVGTPTPRPY